MNSMMKQGSRRLALAIAAASLIFAGAGCSALDQSANSSTATDDGKTKTVTILTHDSFALADEDIARFTKETGYELKTVSAGDGNVINNLRLNKDQPVVDGFFGIDSFGAHEVLSEGLAQDLKEQSKLDDALATASTGILDDQLVPIDRGDVCLNFDRGWFEQKQLTPPESFEDLAKPEYKNLTVLIDPRTSTPGFAFLAASVETYGEEWTSYWESLLANGVKVTDSWSNAYYTDFSGADGKGAYPVVLSYGSSPAYSQGATGSVNATCVQQVEYAGIVKGAQNAEGAQAFIDFLTTKEVQATIPDQMYVYPIRLDVQLPQDWAKYAPMPAHSLSVNLEKVAENRQMWLDAWAKLYEAAAK